jgi:hypothetical protein
MFTRHMRAALIALCTVVVLLSPNSAAAEPFYKGKRLSVLINYAPGGPTDIEGRLFAKHIAKHIDGQPTIVAQNMDGASGLVGTSYLGEVAPKDGTMMGYLTGAAWVYASEPDKHRVDLRTYEFIGYQGGTAVYFVRADVEPGIKDPTDFIKVKGLISGGLGIDSSKDLLIRLTLDMLGVPYRHVTGYRSNQVIRLAIQRNEVSLTSESPPGYRSIVEPTMVKTGMVVPLYYDPGYNGESLNVPKQVEGLPLPPFQDFYRKVKGTNPSGQLWDAYLTVLTVNAAMQRLLALPPRAPQRALDTLRAAVLRLNADPAFAEDANKAMGFVPHYDTGPDTNREVRQALAVKPEMRAFVAEYAKSLKK